MAMGEGWFGWSILFVQSKLRNKGWFVAGVFMVRRQQWGLDFLGLYMGQLRGSCVADCILGGHREPEGMWWAKNWAFVGASSSKKQVNFSVELNEQHINCVQHLGLQQKCHSKT